MGSHLCVEMWVFDSEQAEGASVLTPSPPLFKLDDSKDNRGWWGSEDKPLSGNSWFQLQIFVQHHRGLKPTNGKGWDSKRSTGGIHGPQATRSAKGADHRG
jgi:hypothetical protein